MSVMNTWFGRSLDQDWVDRANGFWSVLLLAFCSVGAFLVRYLTQPISCFTPSTFTASHVDYAKTTCFAEETHRAQRNSSFSDLGETAQDVSYHLWIPLILFLQGLCFKIPHVLWTLVKPSLTINMEATVSSLENAQNGDIETRRVILQRTAYVIGCLLRRNKFLLSLLYLFIKLLYCLNLLGQFLFLTISFRQRVALAAGDVVGLKMQAYFKLLLQKSFICNFTAHSYSKPYNFSVECQLPISEVYEKMFIFLWYWTFFLGVVTFFNLILWAGFFFIPLLKDSRILLYINNSPGSTKESPQVKRFITDFLGIDGVFLLSMITRNSSEIIAADLTQEMFQNFLEDYDANTQLNIDKEIFEPLKPVDITAYDNDVPEVKIVTSKDGVAMEKLSAKDADFSLTSPLEQDGTNEQVA